MQYGAVCNINSCAILLCEYTTTLIMASHWPSLVECMERVPCWCWTNSKYVCSYCCVYNWRYSKLIAVHCSIDAVVWGHMYVYFIDTALYFPNNHNVNDGLALIFVWLNVWNGCRLYWRWTNRKYVCSYCCVYDWPPYSKPIAVR